MGRRPKQKTTEITKVDGGTVVMQVPAGSRYAQVLSLLADGHAIPEVAKMLGMEPRQVFGIRKSAQMRAERMRANDWMDHLIQNSKETSMACVAHPGAGITTEQYNQG